MNLIELANALEPVALEAGIKIMEIYSKDPEADWKGDGSPVTEADRVAEEIILNSLIDIAPDIPVVSEENTARHASNASKIFFLVDPLDGTKEFLKRDGRGSFTVNIALIEDEVPVLGIVFAPALRRLFIGINGVGAVERKNSTEVPLSIRIANSENIVAVASASHRDELTNQWLVENGVNDTISIGSSLKFCLLAAGEADVYPRFGPTMEWDTAAGDAVLRAAGGKTTKIDKAPFVYGKPDYLNGPFIAWGGFS